MADGRRGPERRRNAGAAPSRPRQSPVNLLILTVIGGLVATTAASVIMGGVDDGTPHGRLLGALQRVAEAQEAHHETEGEFTPWTAPLDVEVPEGVEVTVLRGDGARWEALATDRGLGLSCVQSGQWTPRGPVREPPTCYTVRR